jgi:hypothetical protein
MAIKYCKIGLSLNIGNRKASIGEPIELPEGELNTNTCDDELSILVANFAMAVMALPSADSTYTFDAVKSAVADYFQLQPIVGE